MKLYLIERSCKGVVGTYDSAVVAARSQIDARNIHPSVSVTHVKDKKWMGTYGGDVKGTYIMDNCGWVDCVDAQARVAVSFLGTTNKGRGVVLSSFNAG